MRKKHALLSLLFCLSLVGCQEQETIDKEVEIQEQVTSEISYELTQVSKGRIEQVMMLKCTYTETEELEIAFEIDKELITDVYVEKGDSVEKGELIASVDVEATEAKLKDLKHQLAKNELKLKQTIEKRDFELEQADIWFSYTAMTQADKENTEQEKVNITQSFAKSIQSYEDTIHFQKKRIQEYEEYIEKGTLTAPMDGTISWVKADLEGSMTTADTPIARIYNPDSKLYYSENIEAIPYLEEGKEYTIVCGLGKAQREYTVMPAKMDEWGEYIYFKLLDEEYDPNIIVLGKVTLVTDAKENALCIDDNAIHSSGEEYYVYTLDENNVRRMQFVELGLQGAEIVEIVSGLSEGDRVIIK
ncbi:MAG: biotin/lipoyl-binding protein [Lachnospiraceae bacterium]|nr:biotin/lipoyl-binding protein [Lachnospiraceae bacterium]